MVRSIAKLVFFSLVTLCFGDFRAYNDCIRGTGDSTAANVTNWTIYNGYTDNTSGPLIDFETGQSTSVTATFTWNASAGLRISESSGSSDGVSQPRPGTPAYAVFGEIVDFSGRLIYYGSSGWWTEITFTGLNPEKKYTFVTTAIRATIYTDRLTQFTLSGHTSAVNNSSDGVYLKDGDRTVLIAGGNHLNTTGYVVRWDDIRVADRGDGTGQFSVRANAFGAKYEAYPFGGFMLEEAGNIAPTVHAGEDMTIHSPRAYVTLSGTVTDDGQGPGVLESTWSQVSGPAAVEFVSDVHQPQVRVHFPAEGSYQLRLWATDGELSASDDVIVTVNPPVCPVGDINGDCMTTLADLELLALNWLEEGQLPADLTGNLQADFQELALLAESWQEDWTGSLQVVISPVEAIAAGAQWRVNEGPWQSSGDVVRLLAEGVYRVDYSVAGQWVSPDAYDAVITRHETTVVQADYTQPPQLVVISEFMAVNSNVSDLRPAPPIDLYTTIDGQPVYEDWIELHNVTDHPVDISGSYLTDDAGDLTKWQFPPDTVIGAKDYLIVFASGKDPEKYGYPFRDDLGRLHTNFELSSDGEYLALVRSDGQWIEYDYDFPKQRGLVSYGIGSDGRTGYLTGVRFAAANTGTYDGVVGDTSFSVKRGFYDAPITVEIACSTPDAMIRYTTDTSEPTATHGTVYDPASPIVISKTTCLRAAAFKDGWLSSNIDTQTYLFLDNVLVQATNPATGAQVVPEGYPTIWPGGSHSGAVTGDYQVDPDIASPGGQFGHLYAATLKDDLKAIPSISLVVPIEQLFGTTTGIYINQGQDGTERAGSMEFLDPTGAEKFHTNCGVRMQGGANHDGGGTTLNRWKCFKLSMRLTFRGLFGGKLQYPVFGAGAATEYDTLILDSRPQNSWVHENSIQRIRGEYLRDQIASETQLAMGGYGCYGRPVHLYLNGLYWGLYWLHERPDDSFAASYMGGDKADYDVIKHDYGNVISGSNDDYIAMFGISALWPDHVTAFENLKAKLDVADFIDYLLANYYIGNGDWDNKNWYATRNRFDPAGRWRWHMWDGEHIMDDGTMAVVNATTKNTSMAPTGLHQKWIANTEYRMLFADRVHKHFYNGGALTTARFVEMFTDLGMQINRAIVGESARWGDNRNATPHTRNAEWLGEMNRLLSTFIPTRRETVLSQFTGKSPAWYPGVYTTTFYVNGQPQHGGDVPANSLLTLTTGGVLVGYTLDGSDLRLPGGGVSPSAVAYSTPLPLTKSVTVKSRSLVSGVWSALVEATFNVGPVKESIRITELMYHPVNGELEFLELKNIGSESVNLNLVQFTDGIQHTFDDVSVAPGGFVLLVRNKALFESHYTSLPAGVEVIQWASGALDNAGERLTLVDALGRTIQSFKYNDKWYPLTDGDGFSLTICDAYNPDLSAWDNKAGWRISSVADGTPGADDTGLAPDTIVINELLAHSHDILPDWIELYNTTPQAIPIGGWFLSDSGSNLMKYEIPAGTIIPGYGYVVFYEDLHFGSAFAFSANGEKAYLTSGEAGQLTGYQVVQSFGATERAVSVGRYVTSTGEAVFVNMSQPTPGQANAYPQVGPVVITEIQYNPDAFNTGDEYLELHNISSQTVALQDLAETEIAPGVFVDQVVSWSFTEGIDYTFPAGTQIPAGGFLILAKNPTAFNAHYAGILPAGTPVLGPFDGGSLSNGGEQIQLSKPGEQAYGKTRAWICVEQITYDDESPWPAEPDGNGKTLQRIMPAAYGNDPANWTAGEPNPGLL
jgi:hypothetical protein